MIATGSVINVPPIAGLRETGFLDSDDILDAEHLPKSMIILGGGAVCAELADYLRQAGVAVTILQRSHHLLSSEDPDVGECLQKVFERNGTQVVTGVGFQRVERTADGKRVWARVEGEDCSFEAEELFAPWGAAPTSTALHSKRRASPSTRAAWHQ